jgi:hypothetical protein
MEENVQQLRDRYGFSPGTATVIDRALAVSASKGLLEFSTKSAALHHLQEMEQSAAVNEATSRMERQKLKASLQESSHAIQQAESAAVSAAVRMIDEDLQATHRDLINAAQLYTMHRRDQALALQKMREEEERRKRAEEERVREEARRAREVQEALQKQAEDARRLAAQPVAAPAPAPAGVVATGSVGAAGADEDTALISEFETSIGPIKRHLGNLDGAYGTKDLNDVLAFPGKWKPLHQTAAGLYMQLRGSLGFGASKEQVRNKMVLLLPFTR